MPSSRPIIVGNSHINCIGAALEKGNINNIDLCRFNSGKSNTIITSKDVVHIVNNNNHSALFSMIGREHHSRLSMIKTDPPFDFHIPEISVPLDKTCTILPYWSVVELMRERQAHTLHSLAFLRKSLKIPIFHLETPPPKGDDAFLQKSSQGILKALGVQEFELNNRIIRLKMWFIERKVLKKTCKSLGIHYIDSPAAARDHEGFLAPDYYFPDAFHTNDRYGSLLLHQIEKSLQGSRA